jgi:hypothetical protein
LELDYSSPASSAEIAPAGARSSSTETLRVPDFSRYDDDFAARSKLAGRINAANISDSELREFLHERRRLLTKKLDGNITRKEINRLEYVRWTLDRIEDARDGYVLEALENSVVKYDQLADDLKDLYASLDLKRPAKK